MREMIILFLCVGAAVSALLPGVQGVPVSESLEPHTSFSSTNAIDLNYRLHHTFFPSEYTLSIKPYFDGTKRFTFDGEVSIKIKAQAENLSLLTLHSKDLNFTKSDVKIDNGLVVLNVTMTPLYDFCHIFVDKPFNNTLVYTVTIKYVGNIRDDMDGLYRSSYIEKEENKWLVATQLGLTSARKVFPCFDEPRFKAVFKLSIIRPRLFSDSLSNMPIQNKSISGISSVKDTFHPTPLMSSYILAFVVSNFKATYRNETEGKEFGVWARPEASSMGLYAFEAGQKIVKRIDEYLNISYYSMNPKIKMDQVAMPDFSFSAMENWGLIIYKESYLMIDYVESSAKHRQQVVGVLAHEIAHQWFGDYVTCHWWSDTWLNEGFARFFEFEIPDMVESLDMTTQFVTAQVHTAMQADTSVTSVPLTNVDVNSPDEVLGQFGSISYNKGAAVIRMMQHALTNSTFTKGLNVYLNSKKYSVAQPKDLYDALQAQAAMDNTTLSQSSVHVVMGSWVSQAGYPLLQVNINYETGTVNLTQTRFVREGERVPNTIYQIPITFATKNNSDFDNTRSTFIMDKKNAQLLNVTNGHEWVVFNKKQIGYYRVNYDTHSWQMLSSALQSNDRQSIHTLNRAQIIDDVFNFAREKLISYGTMFDVIQFLEDEHDFAPWTAAYAGFAFLRQRFAHTNALPKIEQHMNTLMMNVTEKLGLTDDNTNDNHLHKVLRANTLTIACQLGHKTCIEDSKKLFNMLKVNGTKVNANLREHVYCNAIRHGGDDEFDFLWKKHESENVVNEKMVILVALGCTQRSEKIYAFLEQTISADSGIRKQDIMTCFNSVLTGNQDNTLQVFNFVKRNVRAIRDFYGSNKFQAALANIAYRMTLEQLNQFTRFVKDNTDLTPDEKSSASSAAGTSRIALNWANNNKNDIITWVDKKYNGANSIAISITLISFALVTLLLNSQ